MKALVNSKSVILYMYLLLISDLVKPGLSNITTSAIYVVNGETFRKNIRHGFPQESNSGPLPS